MSGLNCVTCGDVGVVVNAWLGKALVVHHWVQAEWLSSVLASLVSERRWRETGLLGVLSRLSSHEWRRTSAIERHEIGGLTLLSKVLRLISQLTYFLLESNSLFPWLLSFLHSLFHFLQVPLQSTLFVGNGVGDILLKILDLALVSSSSTATWCSCSWTATADWFLNLLHLFGYVWLIKQVTSGSHLWISSIRPWLGSALRSFS